MKEDNIMFIKNYGLFWRRDDVWWGVRGNRYHRGEFQGKRTNKERARIVDLRNQIGFYVLYDIHDNQDDKLVYCGYSGEGSTWTLFKRIRQHQQGNERLVREWNQFSWFGIGELGANNIFPQGDLNNPEMRLTFLKQIEAIMITTSRPIENLDAGSFRKAKKYLQHPHPRTRNQPPR